MHGLEVQRVFGTAAWTELSASAQSVWLTMAAYVNGKRVYLGGHQKLADALGKHKSSITKAVRALERAGVVEIIQVGRAAKTGEYRLVIPDEEVVDSLASPTKNADTPPTKNAGTSHQIYSSKGDLREIKGEGSAHAQENFGNDFIPEYIPGDDPDGLFSPTTLGRTHAREAKPNSLLSDLLLVLATTFLGKSQCVYWGKNLAEELEVSAREGWHAWKQLCSAGRLVKVVNCQWHNGERLCYRPPRSEPVAGQDEQSAYSPVFGVNFSMSAAETLAEEKARQERERAEAKMRPPINLPGEDMAWMNDLLDTLSLRSLVTGR